MRASFQQKRRDMDETNFFDENRHYAPDQMKRLGVPYFTWCLLTYTGTSLSFTQRILLQGDERFTSRRVQQSLEQRGLSIRSIEAQTLFWRINLQDDFLPHFQDAAGLLYRASYPQILKGEIDREDLVVDANQSQGENGWTVYMGPLGEMYSALLLDQGIAFQMHCRKPHFFDEQDDSVLLTREQFERFVSSWNMHPPQPSALLDRACKALSALQRQRDLRRRQEAAGQLSGKVKLGDLRLKAGLSARQLARASTYGISYPAIARIEQGTAVAEVRVLEATLEVLNRHLGTAYVLQDLEGVSFAPLSKLSDRADLVIQQTRRRQAN
jgi:transcriptional regulator with XRE-family HTH domain